MVDRVTDGPMTHLLSLFDVIHTETSCQTQLNMNINMKKEPSLHVTETIHSYRK